MAVKKYLTGINAYLAGLDIEHPIPTKGLPKESVENAREVEAGVEFLSIRWGNRLRQLSVKG